MEPAQSFLELLNTTSESAVDLGRGAILLAACADPGVDVAHELERLDQLAAGCSEPTLDGLRRHLFGELGFAGDTDDYYDPDNSLLPSVLDRRIGLPITLSVLCIEVGRRIGAPLVGIGMPGHFLVRDQVLPDVFVDPFAGGVLLDRSGCERRFRALAGERAPFRESYLAPVTPAAILGRMVANLVGAYWRRDDRRNLRWAARVRSECPGVAASERVQIATALAYTGAYDRAAEQYAAAADGHTGDDADRFRTQAKRQHARLN